MDKSLTDQYIEDTFQSLLHAGLEQLPTAGTKPIYDGNGNKTALELGREENGAKISGDFEVSETLKVKDVRYPIDTPDASDIVVADSFNPNNLKFISLKNLLDVLGGLIADGTYKNPTLEFKDGILTNVTDGTSTSRPKSGIFSYATVNSPYQFVVPDGVTNLKFIVTGGGGTGGSSCGGSGCTIIGYLDVTPGDALLLNVGEGGRTRHSRGGASTLQYKGITVAWADGGNATRTQNPAYGAIDNTLNNISSYLIIPGGSGHMDTDDGGDEESLGAASYWGTSPAWGGGSGAHANNPWYIGAGGVIVLEW